MIIAKVTFKNLAQVIVVEDDQMIQTLATYASDHPLDVRILPRTARGDRDFFAPYILHAVLERRTVNGVPIP